MSRHKYFLVPPLLLLLFWSVARDGWHLIPAAHAADTSVDDIINVISQGAGIAITAMNVMMWIIFKFLDVLMDPAFMFDMGNSSATGLLAILHEIWQLMRDLVNVIFAVLLVVGAIITIVSSKTETVKHYMPKFVLAVVLVNFSWFIPRVVIDVSQVMTYTVFQIPSLIGTKCTIKTNFTSSSGQTSQTTVPCKRVGEVAFFEDANKHVDGQNGWRCPVEGLVCYLEQNMDESNLSMQRSNVLNGLIVNHARMASLAQVTQAKGGNDVGEVRKLLMFVIRLIIVLLLHVAFFFPLLALAVAFFIRIPILWVTMAFMPLAFVGFVIGDKMGELDTMKKIWSRFLGAAFLPVLAAIPISIGFVMVNAGVNMTPSSNFMTELKGLPLLAGVTDFWQFMWMLIALFVLWTELFPILKKDEIIGKFTAPIEQFGQSFGKAALKAPLAVPFLPGPGDSKISLLQAAKTFSPSRINALEDSGQLFDQHGKFNLGRMINISDPGIISRGKDIVKKNINVTNQIHSTLNVTPADLEDKTKANEILNRVAEQITGIREFQTDRDLSVLDKKKIIQEILTEGTSVGLSDADIQKLKKALETSRKP